MSLLFIALSIAGILGVSAGVLWTMAILLPPIHIYKQLRAGYSLRRFSAAWRLLVLLPLIGIAALLFLQALALLGTF